MYRSKNIKNVQNSLNKLTRTYFSDYDYEEDKYQRNFNKTLNTFYTNRLPKLRIVTDNSLVSNRMQKRYMKLDSSS